MDETTMAGLRGRLRGKVAVVTGAGTTPMEDPVTIGHAIAVALAAGDAFVVVVDRDKDAAARSVELIRRNGGEASMLIADISSRADCESAIEQVVAEHGRVDILVNNAAIIGGAGWKITGSDEDMQDLMNVNWLGPIRMIRECLPHMPRGSSIVNIGSFAAYRNFGQLDYSSAKAALHAATRTLAVEHGKDGVRVNTVSPGTVISQIGIRFLLQRGASEDEIAARRREKAEFVPLGIEGTGWDVALAVFFFASDESRWITGQDLLVDAGLSCMGLGV